MKKVSLIVLLIFIGFGLLACKAEEKPKPIDPMPPITEEPETGYVVNFESNGGSEIPKVELEEMGKINAPLFPTKDDHLFNGWYIDEGLTTIFDFSNDYITGPTKLYAKWTLSNENYMKSFKVLSIGNSFSEDAHRYLWQIAESYGIPKENILIANMYIGGAELEKHVANLRNEAAIYTYQEYKGPNQTGLNNYKLSEAIVKENWDVVTFQQASHDSGIADKYGSHINTLVSWVKEKATNKNVKIGWHMTWAYQQDANHSGFLNYERNQNKMYEMILDTLEQKVYSTHNMNFIIPSGTAIQNARTSYLNDNLTRDGYHLTDPMGRFIAGLVYFKSITGFDINQTNVTFAPDKLLKEDIDVAFESMNNAINNPTKVTNSLNLVAPKIEEPVLPDIKVDGEILEFDIQLGFWNQGATSVSPETDGLHNKFISTLPLSNELLPVGSSIVLEDGYQYRVIFLEKNENGFKVVKRSNNYYDRVVTIDENFFEAGDYVAFNIAPKGNNQDLTLLIDEITSKFKLYQIKELVDEAGYINFKYELGFWNSKATSISPETDALHNKFLAIHPIDKKIFKVGSKITLEEGFQYRTIHLDKQNDAFVVVDRSNNYTVNELILDESFFSKGEYIAFNVAYVGNKEVITDRLDFVASKIKLQVSAS